MNGAALLIRTMMSAWTWSSGEAGGGLLPGSHGQDAIADLLSDLSSGVTGENVHVDCGYHIVGMKAVDAPDIATV